MNRVQRGIFVVKLLLAPKRDAEVISSDVSQVADRFLAKALGLGGSDNISLVLVKIS